MPTTIPVVEYFGPTIQGEGIYTGQICAFIRTAGCDNNCVWCDTAFAQATSSDDVTIYAVNEIAYEVAQLDVPRVVVTGGNPAIHSSLYALINFLHTYGMTVHVETQGTVTNQGFLRADHITMSPKPPSSDNPLDIQKADAWINEYGTSSRQNMEVKIVIFGPADFHYAKKFIKHIKALRHIPVVLQVGNPMLGTAEPKQLLDAYRTLIRNVAEEPEFRNVRVLPQLHTLVYGNERGV